MINADQYARMLQAARREGLHDEDASAFLAYQQAERQHRELMAALERLEKPATIVPPPPPYPTRAHFE